MAWINIIIFIYFVFGTALGSFQSKTVFENVTTGIISIEPVEYQPNKRCEWLIINPDPINFPFISLEFSKRETECSFDYVMVFNGSSYNDELLATLSGNSVSTSLPQIHIRSQTMIIYFISDHNYQLSGFHATFHMFPCLNNCSGHGTCKQNQCQCQKEWGGADCSKHICPNSCSDYHGRKHGTCDHQFTKRCTCFPEYVGIGCEMTKDHYSLDNTWVFVYDYADQDEGFTTGLAGHAGVYISPYLWVFGGYNLNCAFDNLIRYDFSANDWDLVRSVRQPSSRYYHTMSHIQENGDDYLLVFGGNIDAGVLTNELWSYDIELSQWDLIPNNLNGTLCPLSQHAAAVVEMKNDIYLYVFGGRVKKEAQVVLSSDIFRFCWMTDTWEKVYADPASFTSSTLKRAGHSMIYDETSQSLVVFGGYCYSSNLTCARSNQIFLFDLSRNFWIEVKAAAIDLPKPMAYHTASVLGDYMIVFGGSTHVHKSDESCHSHIMYFYNLRCNTWLLKTYVKGQSPSGRFSHFAAVYEEGHLLFIHGGYNGMISNQLFVYRLPVFAMKNIVMSVSAICRSHVRKLDCLVDQRCVWCTNSACVALNEASFCSNAPWSTHSSTLETTVIFPKCPGLCDVQATCLSCSILHSYKLNSTYDWETIECNWCIPDMSCNRADHLPDNSKCRQTTAWGSSWRDSATNLVNTTSECIEYNVPLGFQAAFYYNNPSLTSPDEVVFIKDEFNLRKVVNPPQGSHTVVIQGFLHIFDSTVFLSPQPKIRLDSAGGLGRLYLSSDDRKDNAKLLLMDFKDPLSSEGNDSGKALETKIGSKNRLFYEVVRTFNGNSKPVWKGSLKVLWNIAPKTPLREFFEIKSNYLEPYRSDPDDESICHSHHDCAACLLDFNCAWCSGSRQCISRTTISLSSQGLCLDPSFGTTSSASQKYFGIVLDMTSCSNCTKKDSCYACVADSTCVWNDYRGCVNQNYYIEDVGVSSASECPSPCSSRTTCADCLQDKAHSCRWCENTQRCYQFRYHRLINSMGQCREWILDKEQCMNCDAHITCQGCVRNFQCGWCGFNSSHFQGTCMYGDFSGPNQKGSCSVNSTGPVSTSEWIYGQCDVNECTTEWPPGTSLHNCSPNATCMDTPDSFKCFCNRGFEGNGSHCSQICFKRCLQGKCSGSPDYRCECSLGWTEDSNPDVDCHVNCQCNFHSTCTRGIGKCDLCFHNTQGKHCDKCLPQHFGIATSANGCEACQCNGHGDIDRNLCNATTGDCYCLDNTWGKNCEKCLSGYYGNPRNGGTCYSNCLGRTLYPPGIQSGAFGTWNKLFEPSIRPAWFCLWVVNASANALIELKIIDDIYIDCSVERMLVYDDVLLSGNTSLFVSICGEGLAKNMHFFSNSGLLSVYYETNDARHLTEFNATFHIYPHNALCDQPLASCQEVCPNNCSADSDRGFCLKGVCRCRDGFIGKDCSLTSEQLEIPVYWQLEWSGQLDRLDATARSLIRYGESPGPLRGHSLVSFRNSLWLFGGYSRKRTSADLWRYVPSKKTWTKITSSSTGGSPSARRMHAAVTSSATNSMLVYGGLSVNGRTRNDFWEFYFDHDDDTIVHTWSKIPSNIHLPKVGGHTLTFCSGSLLLIGGYSSDNGINKKVWSYSISTRQWTQMQTIGSRFPGAFGHSSVCDDVSNSVYVFGGLRSKITSQNTMAAQDSIYVFNVLRRRWSAISAVVFQKYFTKRPTLYFHSALPYNQGSDRGFLVFGGQHGPNATMTSTWLFRYDCRMLINLQKERTEIEGDEHTHLHAPVFGSGVAAAVMIKATNNSLPTYYVHGGDEGGILIDALQTIHVTSPCFTASTTCECLQLRAGCVLCPGGNDEEHQSCLPANTTLSECNILQNHASGTDQYIKSSSCSSCEENATTKGRCSSSAPREHHCHLRCIDLITCEACLSHLPANGQPFCKWCSGDCRTKINMALGTCVPMTSSCDMMAACEKTECDSCDEATCLSCQTSSSCVWKRLIQQSTFPDDEVYTCSYVDHSFLNRLPMLHKPIITSRQSSQCPNSCSQLLNCEACLVSGGGAAEGPSACFWSVDLGYCFDSGFYPLLCFGGFCGHIIRSKASSCPLTSCSSVTYCKDCINTKTCGWSSVAAENGGGYCQEGDFKHPSEELPRSGLPWNYMSCPKENECINGHHTCSRLQHSICVDLDEGYNCECQTNYTLSSDGSNCNPVCNPECKNGGKCISPNTCECMFGFIGQVCDHVCDCHGNSHCTSSAAGDICLNCINNTEGNKCQYCKINFVGDPTNTPVGSNPCTPCSTVCHHRTSVCGPDHAPHIFWPGVDRSSYLHGPKHISESMCMDCSGYSEGRHCQFCIDGYFELEGKCQKCDCNGHADVCDKQTGKCACQNYTTTLRPGCYFSQSLSSTSGCWKHQCNKCIDQYEGDPENGGQCYYKVNTNDPQCFYPNTKSQCSINGGGHRFTHLLPGQTILFVLQPGFSDLDSRLLVDVTTGEVDVYVSGEEDTFGINVDPYTGQHRVVLKTLPKYNATFLKSTPNLSKTKPRRSLHQPLMSEYWSDLRRRRHIVKHHDGKTTLRTVEASDFTSYFTLRQNEALRVSSVRNRLVVVCPYVGFDQKDTRMMFYVIIRARRTTAFVTSSDDDVLPKDARSVSDPDATLGRLLFTQGLTAMDYYIFFSVLGSSVFLVFAITFLIWKVKQVFDNQQARLAHDLELQNMASRPFSWAYVYWPDSPTYHRLTPFHPPKKSAGRTLPRSPQKVTKKSKKKTRTSATVRPVSTGSDISSANTIVRAAFTTNSSSSSLKSSLPSSSSALAASGSKSSSLIEERGIMDATREDDWRRQAIGREVVVDDKSSDNIGHDLPLPHATSNYLTVLLDDQGDPRLTPERDPSNTSPASSSSSTPALCTPSSLSSSLTSKSNSLSSANMKAPKNMKLKPNHVDPCPIAEGPIVFQPTCDYQAEVISVILQLPGVNRVPSAMCLGSALVNTSTVVCTKTQIR